MCRYACSQRAYGVPHLCQQAVVQGLAASRGDDGHNFMPRAFQCRSLYNPQDEACRRLLEQQVFTCSGGTKDMTAWPEYRHRINTSSSNNYRSDVTLWMLGNKSIHLITWFLHDSLIWTWDWFISWSHTVRIPEGFRCVRVWERVFFHGRVAGLNLSKLWKSMRAKQEHNPPSPFQLIKCAVNLK